MQSHTTTSNDKVAGVNSTVITAVAASIGSPEETAPTWMVAVAMLASVAALLWYANNYVTGASRSFGTTAGIIVSALAFIPLAAMMMRANDRKSAAAAAYVPNALKALTERYGEGDYYLTASPHRVIGVAWDQRLVVMGDTLDSAEGIGFEAIGGANVEIDGATVTTTTSTTKTNRGSQIGGAAAGAALLGPAGLLLGGLSGSSRTKGRSSESRYIKSVTLVVRVADRSMPLRRIDFMLGIPSKVSAPHVKEALAKAAHYHALIMQIIDEKASDSGLTVGADHRIDDQIDRLWTLHEKGALSRAEYDGQKAKLLSAASVAKLAIIGLVACSPILSLPRPAFAYDLGHILRGTPEARLQSTKPIGDVEKCIVLLDLPGPPVVYHYPDAPGTLVHGGREAYPLFVFELVPAVDHLDVVIWQGIGQRSKLEKCL